MVSKYTDNCLNFFKKFLKGVLLLRVRMNFEMLSNMKTLIRFSDLYGLRLLRGKEIFVLAPFALVARTLDVVEKYISFVK